MTRDIEQTPVDPSQVKGWGADADRGNDPTYPMKRRNDGEHEGYSWERPAQQQSDAEVLHSNERPNLSAAFGTSTPPAGLSGAIRRFAFKYSESSYGHWLPLMLADFVNRHNVRMIQSRCCLRLRFEALHYLPRGQNSRTYELERNHPV